MDAATSPSVAEPRHSLLDEDEIAAERSGPHRPRVVVIGGGFGGLEAARNFADAPFDVVLVDKRNHHLFQPLLYQVATAGLSAPDIAMPIRKVLADQENARVLLAEVKRIDAPRREVVTADGVVPYDYLIVATGLTNNYFGKPEWEAHAPGLKSLHDALEIRKRVLLAFERAELCDEPEAREALLTFCVVGGGPTGVELAGALAEIARHTLARNFRDFDPADARVVLVEGGQRILAGFDDDLSDKAARRLEKLGVELRFGNLVSAIDAEGLVVGGERIHAKTVLWAAGVGGRGLVGTIEGAELDRMGRIGIAPTLQVPGQDRVFAIGDIARFETETGTLPGVAQVAIQQGKTAAMNIRAHQSGLELDTFRYNDLGSMATIGRSAAVAQIGDFKTSGFLAWLIWTFVHIMALVGFRNRVVVLFNWASAYIFWSRGARIILEEPVGQDD